MYPHVAIVLLNWNGWRDTIDCMGSLAAITYPCWDVVVVDNKSRDDSVERLENWAREAILCGRYQRCDRIAVVDPLYSSALSRSTSREPHTRSIALLENDTNAGFSRGNNVGVRWALANGADYVLLLNNDTTVHPEFLNRMIVAAERDDHVAVVVPMMYYYDRPDTVWYGGADLPRFGATAKVRHLNERVPAPERLPDSDVQFVTGACMLVKASAFRRHGLLDEDFFFGGEDYEFSQRLARAGGRLLHVPSAVVWHKVGGARSLDDRFVYGGYKAQVLYRRKTMSPVAFWAWIAVYGAYVGALAPFRLRTRGNLSRLRFWRSAVRGVIDGCRGRPVQGTDLHGSA
jgi:hypothetical protein